MSKPRFLFVLEHHFLRATGGAETQCWMMATELARRGWDVHYASEMNEIPQPNPLDGVTLHGLPENPPRRSRNQIPLRALMQELNPDVVLNQVVNLYTVNSILDAPPNAFTIYLGAADNDGLLWTFLRQLRGTSRLRSYLRWLPLNYYVRRKGLQALRKASLVLAQHRVQQQQFDKGGIQAQLLRNVHPRVPDSDVQTHTGKPVVLWVGSIKPWKRPELFLELAERCKDLDAEFRMVGALAHEGYQERIESTQRSLPNFRYQGFVPFAEVGNEFSQAHVFVSTSVAEGFANTFIQSWIRGVPVASLRVDPEDILKEKQLGICASTMDELESAVRELVSDPARRKEIGARARAFAVQEFDLEKVVDKLEAMLRAGGVKTP